MESRLLLICLMLAGCQTLGNVKVYSLQPSKERIAREQEEEYIDLVDIRDNSYQCLSNQDVRTLMDLAKSCASEDK